jgi:RecB family exonuclease
MSLHAYYMPPGAAKGRNDAISGIIKNICTSELPDLSTILYLTPTHQILNARKDEIHKIMGGTYIPPKMITLRHLARELTQSYSSNSLLPFALRPALISRICDISIGHATLVAEFISEIKQNFPGLLAPELKEKLDEAFAKTDTSEEATERAYSALNMLDAYTGALAGAQAMDDDDTLHLASSLIKKAPTAKALILDGFYELTPVEETLISTLISSNPNAYAIIPVSSINDDNSYCYINKLKSLFELRTSTISPSAEPAPLQYRPLSSTENEVEQIARSIKHRFITAQDRNLGNTCLIFPKPGTYEQIVQRIFARFGIPLDSTPDTARIKAYQDLLAMLEAVSEGYPRTPFTRFLQSPYFKGIPESLRLAIPEIAFTSGVIKGRSAWLKAFAASDFQDEAAKIFRLLETLKNINKSTTYNTLIKVLLNILRTLKFSPLQEGTGAVESVFAPLRALDGITEGGPSIADFLEGLRATLPAWKKDNPSGVRLLSLLEARGLEPDALYFGGLKDGDIPARPDMDFILPDAVRKEIGLVDTHRHLQLQEVVFNRLTKAATWAHLSYPSNEGDKIFLPSLFLSDMAESGQNGPIELFTEEDVQMNQPQAISKSDYLNEISNIHAFSKTSSMRVTDIDSYRYCPRRFFIERKLGLSPSEITEYEIDARDLGTLAHKFMETLLDAPAGAEDEFMRKAAAVAKKVATDSGLDDYFSALFQDTMQGLALQIYQLEDELSEGGFAIQTAEKALKHTIDQCEFKGKIDRIDSKPSGELRVMDYKTGHVSLTGSSTLKKGKNLQLFIYAAMLRAQGQKPTSVGIYSLKDITLKEVPGSQDIKAEHDLDTFMDAALDYLTQTIAMMRTGDFPARPMDESTCTTCHEKPFCPFIHNHRGDSND